MIEQHYGHLLPPHATRSRDILDAIWDVPISLAKSSCSTAASALIRWFGDQDRADMTPQAGCALPGGTASSMKYCSRVDLTASSRRSLCAVRYTAPSAARPLSHRARRGPS
jgi:hypothetical protein